MAYGTAFGAARGLLKVLATHCVQCWYVMTYVLRKQSGLRVVHGLYGMQYREAVRHGAAARPDLWVAPRIKEQFKGTVVRAGALVDVCVSIS